MTYSGILDGTHSWIVNTAPVISPEGKGRDYVNENRLEMTKNGNSYDDFREEQDDNGMMDDF